MKVFGVVVPVTLARNDSGGSASRFSWTSRCFFGDGAALLAGVLMAALSTGLARAQPVSVSYTTTALSGSQWQYSYQVAGSFSSGDDLAIYFPLATSSGLTDLGTGGPDWTTFVLQPDAGLPSDGEFDLVANVDSPSLLPTFAADFQYSGSGAPGSQAFTLFDPTFTPIGSGVTQPAVASTVPEPTSFVLLGTGALSVAAMFRRRLL